MPKISTYADDQLVALLQGGDAEAFTEIYIRYWKLLFYVSSKRLNNYTEAEETVQNIFTDLWARRTSINIHTSLKYYLATAVQYQVMNFLAKKQILNSLEQTENKPSANVADQALTFHELQQQIMELVRALPEKCRLVYHLSREKGLSHKNIASNLGISEKTVENQITKALARIRAGLDDPALMLVLLLAFFIC